MAYPITPKHRAALEREAKKSADDSVLKIIARYAINNDSQLTVADFTAAQYMELCDLIAKGLVLIKPNTNFNSAPIELTEDGLAKILSESF